MDPRERCRPATTVPPPRAPQSLRRNWDRDGNACRRWPGTSFQNPVEQIVAPDRQQQLIFILPPGFRQKRGERGRTHEAKPMFEIPVEHRLAMWLEWRRRGV